jgi:3',5'-cyclic AMP phosphodiesterase CpdA
LLIAQVTDIHIGFEPASPDELNMRRLGVVLRRLVEGPNRPDLLLLSGDLTEFGDAESYARLVEALSGCPFPVWPMAGNHDLREPLLAAFPQVRSGDGFVHYALDCGGFRLLALDTFEPGRHGGGFCAARAAWLEAQLATDRNTPVIVAMHHPPFESGIQWLDSDAREPWIARFADAIAGHSQVKAIIAGHLHRNIHAQWNSIPVTVCTSSAPSLALDLNPIDPDRPDGREMITDEPPGYALHRWDGERLVSHFQCVLDHNVLARYDESMQKVVRLIDSERPGH